MSATRGLSTLHIKRKKQLSASGASFFHRFFFSFSAYRIFHLTQCLGSLFYSRDFFSLAGWFFLLLTVQKCGIKSPRFFKWRGFNDVSQHQPVPPDWADKTA